ncbi:DUF2860 family protein [Litoribrevibacter albus]|uniref:DUF2860 domain-containing protein n=1 Tax=Litoribrevibacter albus TaxID=1473156 RepID=A0AA37S707_9GAMM|nr:DUF2860 family protein [Litoribrevibacter albus]GLQ29566.1 hypothetical protein GCM10007876_00440 [Litoribrevibacter albus]
MARPISLAAAIALSLSSTPLIAEPIKPIPQESGFSGSLVVGLSATEYSSNMIAGPNGDLADSNIDSLDDKPGSESDVSPFFTGELNYTFSKSRTQLFLGSALEDLVRYDLTFQAGVRQELADKSIVYGAYLFSAIPTEVYADPYQTGSSRDETDRASSGARIGWQGIMGSGFGVELTHRSIELDDEDSGDALVAQGAITAAQQDDLSREGDLNAITISYRHSIAQGQFLVPEINYRDYDLDGEAMAKSQYGGSLAYFYNTPQYSLITTVFYSHFEHDEENPIYGITEEGDSFGGSIVGTYHNLFGWEGFSGLATVGYAESDSDINFYDADVVTGSLGVLYRF